MSIHYRDVVPFSALSLILLAAIVPCLPFSSSAAQKPGITFKQVFNEWERLAGDSSTTDSAFTAALNDSTAMPKEECSGGKAAADSSNKKLLLLTGDSMVGCLSWAFAKYCRTFNRELKTIPFVASTTGNWAKRRYIARLIKKYHPEYIILCLGSNEFYFGPKAIKLRAGYIKQIIDQADTIPLLWIGPPNLDIVKDLDTVISENIGTDRYFQSSALILDRQSDNRHPSVRASWVWSDTVARWIQFSSKYKLKILPDGCPSQSTYAAKKYDVIASARIKKINDSILAAKTDSPARIHSGQTAAATTTAKGDSILHLTNHQIRQPTAAGIRRR